MTKYLYPYAYQHLDGLADIWGAVWAETKEEARVEATRRAHSERGHNVGIGQPKMQQDDAGVYRDMDGWALRDAWGVPEQAAAYAADMERKRRDEARRMRKAVLAGRRERERAAAENRLAADLRRRMAREMEPA